MNEIRHQLTKRQASFLDDLTHNRLSCPIETLETHSGAISATITPTQMVKLEVFDRLLRDHAGIHVTLTGLDDLITTLQRVAATIRDHNVLQTANRTSADHLSPARE